MKNFILIALFVSFNVSAAIPEIVLAKAEELKQTQIRNEITAVENTDGNPCLPEGTSYNVETLIQKSSIHGGEVVSKWESVKSVNISATGEVMEICME